MKTVLITGANSGFGFHTTLEFINAGYQVIATVRHRDKTVNLVDEVKKLNKLKQLDLLTVDITNEADIMDAYQYVQEKYGKLNILINNAGYSAGGFLTDISFADWQNQQITNVHGTVLMTKTFLPLLKKSDKGKIINISSVSGVVGLPGMSAYSASKFALEGFSESLRLELLKDNIYVTLIEPSAYQTAIWEKAFSNMAPFEHGEKLKLNVLNFANQSAQNGGNPVEVAELIVKISRKNKPRLRYPIGKGANMLSIVKRLLPWSIIEKIMIKQLNNQ